MLFRLDRHFLYTRLVRPIGRVMAWCPLFFAFILLTGPLTLAAIIVLIPVVVLSMLLSFRPSVAAAPTLTQLLSRHK